jgi:hypothetical protein
MAKKPPRSDAGDEKLTVRDPQQTAAYVPEANVLVPLDSTATGSNTPTSKQIIVRLEPVDGR